MLTKTKTQSVLLKQHQDAQLSPTARQAGALALQLDFRSSKQGIALSGRGAASSYLLSVIWKSRAALRSVLRGPCSLLSRPGNEAELVVLLQMGMSGQDADTETVGAGLACRN